MKSKIFLFIIGMFLFSFVSADITCNPTTITAQYEFGTEYLTSVSCNNNGNSTTIFTTGSYISTTETAFSTGSKSIPITLSSSAPEGLHSGILNFGSGESVPIAFNVLPVYQQSSCSINIFPTTLTNVKISQGEIKTRTITLSVPSCFESAVTVQGITLQTDQKPIALGEISVGNLNPGQSINIPIEINAEGVAMGQYSDVLQFLLYNSSGNTIPVSNTNIGVLVSQGVTPISNFSLTEVPVCSLSATELGLNKTYSLACSISNPNIKVEPSFDNDYIVGVSDTSTSSQYIYNFRAKKTGNTIFGANFYYEGSSGKSYIGEPYSQSIKITYSGSSVVGSVNLDLVFYQKGKSKDKNSLGAEETIIHVVDNSSKDILEEAKLYLGGEEMQNFTLTLELEGIYELTATHPGYLPLYTNISASEIPISFSLSPSKTSFAVGESVDITSEVENVSYLIDNAIMNLPYTFNSAGNFTITSVKEGYSDTSMNISVTDSVFIKLGLTSEWKKGEDILLDLNKNCSWEVKFIGSSKDKITGNVVYSGEPSLVASGTGTRVSFKIEDSGRYEIYGDNVSILTRDVESSFWKNKPWWFWWIVVPISVIAIWIIIVKLKNNISSSSSKDDGLPFAGTGVN